MATVTQVTYSCDWPGCAAEISADDQADQHWSIAPGALVGKAVELCAQHRAPLRQMYGKRSRRSAK